MSPQTEISKFGQLIALVLLFCMPGFAQFSSSIEGTVIDSSGAVVPDVAIRVINEQTGVVSNGKTSEAGYYIIPALPAGRYRLEASKPGFSTAVHTDVSLEAARVQSVPLVLSVGSVSAEISVTGAAPPVETSEAHVSQITTAAEVLDLPFEGRNILNVIAQTPGVTGTGLVSDRAGSNDIFNASNAPSVTANGQRGSSNGFYVDDSSVNDNPDEGGAKLSPNPDSVAEVRVSVNNYSAQYGRNSSILTQIITKSGTNQLHGSLFEYHTNNKLTSRVQHANPRNRASFRERAPEWNSMERARRSGLRFRARPHLRQLLSDDGNARFHCYPPGVHDGAPSRNRFREPQLHAYVFSDTREHSRRRVHTQLRSFPAESSECSRHQHNWDERVRRRLGTRRIRAE
jgi:hypothetical protein